MRSTRRKRAKAASSRRVINIRTAQKSPTSPTAIQPRTGERTKSAATKSHAATPTKKPTSDTNNPQNQRAKRFGRAAARLATRCIAAGVSTMSMSGTGGAFSGVISAASSRSNNTGPFVITYPPAKIAPLCRGGYGAAHPPVSGSAWRGRSS